MANSNESNLAEGIGLQPGEKIGRYEVIARIAIGGQSIIYKCHDPSLDRLVAIKQISTHLAEDKMFLDRFRSEAQILARLGAEQPEVVTIHDLLENKQGLFIVMEFVEGVSLEKTLAGNPDPVELKATLQILWRLCSALHTVHVAGVVHRDIKPSNIIIADGLRPMITDFGVAATASGEASMVMGTTKYMAPELFTGGYVDGRADMYSLGFIAYEMLVGREKFNEIFADIVRDRTAEKVRWMKWHSNPKVSAPPPHEVNPIVPVTLSNIVLKMIAKDSEKRFAGMEDLGRAIKQTFRPGAKAAGPAAGAAASMEEDITAEPGGRVPDAMAFDMEESATAPIPKRKISLRAKIAIAVAASVLLIGTVVVLQYRAGQRAGGIRQKAYAAYKDAREVYKSDQDYATAEKKFLAVSNDFGPNEYTSRSQVYIQMCRAQLAVLARDWSRAQIEQDSASTQRTEIQKKCEVGSKLYEWTVDMKDTIKAFNTRRISRKGFDEKIKEARRMYGEGKYEEAVTMLEREYDEPGELDDDLQKELIDFKERATRTQSLNECQALLVAARKVAEADTGAALAAYDKASAGLQRLKKDIDEAKWNKMNSEVQKTLTKLKKARGINDIMAGVDNARQSKNKPRLLRALKNAMAKPGVPSELVENWAAEIKSIQETIDFKEITDLLGENDIKGAMDKLDPFIAKYPGHRKAKAIKKALDLKEREAALKREAYSLFDRGRWAEALEKLTVLRVQNRGDRDIKEKVLFCQYKLEMVIFNAAVKANDYAKAEASGERARLHHPDAWDTEIEPKLVDMKARKKVRDTLDKAKAALDSAQYSLVRQTLKELRDAYPEAKEMYRRSQYLENIAKGDASRREGDIKTAWAMYKAAKSKAKGAQEHAKVDALIEATAPD